VIFHDRTTDPSHHVAAIPDDRTRPPVKAVAESIRIPLTIA
jgi:hypothetical protein